MLNEMKRYLLIDDEEIFNFIQSEVIYNYAAQSHITSFTSPVASIQYLQKTIADKTPMPHFILLDIRMPEMNGFEFLDTLSTMGHEHFKKTDIYMLSSSLDEKDVTKALAHPCVKGFKEKPLSDQIIVDINRDYVH